MIEALNDNGKLRKHSTICAFYFHYRHDMLLQKLALNNLIYAIIHSSYNQIDYR